MKKACCNCQKETENPKFCSKSCSCTYNNKVLSGTNKRRMKTKKCDTCNILIHSNVKYCNKCFQQTKDDLKNRTLDEIIQKNCQRSGRYSKIRGYARREYLNSNRTRKCINCGYDKHIEICHIKPINLYDKNTKIKEINKNSNIVALCKNCHWELDHKLLDKNHILNLLSFDLNEEP